jgi:DNA modification methylase
MFVGHIVLVARALWRVLREDGTFWLNFGDSYATGAGKVGNCPGGGKQGENWQGLTTSPNRLPQAGLKPKDLIGIPWRVAFALQADGWYLRSDIIWAKGVSFCDTYSGSCMPESVTDRPTKGHEHVFLLSKSKRYFYDGDAVKESADLSRVGQNQGRWGNQTKASRASANNQEPSGNEKTGAPVIGGTTRTLRTVWTINPGSYAGAHFATFPPALVEPMIKAGTSAKGCCPECGASWERVTEKEFIPQQDVSREKGIKGSGTQKPMDASNGWEGFPRGTTAVTTIGWTPTCTCYNARYRSDYPQAKSARKRYQRRASGNWFRRVRKRPGLSHWPVDPCTVLDLFAGTFTTGEVAIRLGRRAVGIELSKAYCDDHIIPRLEQPLQMEMAL